MNKQLKYWIRKYLMACGYFLMMFAVSVTIILLIIVLQSR